MSNKKARVPFRLTTTFTWPVKFTYAVDGGDYVDCEIDAVFKRLTLTEFSEATRKIVNKETEEGSATNEIRDFLREVTKDILNFEYDQEASADQKVARVTDDLAIAGAMYAAYNSAILGRELQLGNLETPQS